MKKTTMLFMDWLSPMVIGSLALTGLHGCATIRSQEVTQVSGLPTVLGDQALPVKRVVLFQNGVAYLERRGAFRGDELHLRVRPSQIRDILKSVTVVDLKGGHASSLSLPVDIGNEKALSELPKVGLGQGALGSLLNVLRGAQVRLQVGSDSFEGRMVGVEAGGEKNGEQVSLLTREGIIRTFPREKLSSVRLLDPTLAQGLEKGLDISLGQEAWKSIDLALYLNKGESSERDLLVSYLVEMPTWKPTYRLVLDKTGQPLLQGWAIVDNVSGSDWNDVQLTLTTGSPVSFHYDLYTPRFVQRPDLTPYQMIGITPPVAVSTLETGRDRWTAGQGDVGGGLARPRPSLDSSIATRAPSGGAAGRSRAGVGGSLRESRNAELANGDYNADEKFEAPEDEPVLSSDTLYNSMRVQAQTQKIGSLYRFDLPEPMTVPNRSSTMIALLNTKIPGEAIYYFNPQAGLEASRQHPFRAVSIQNQFEAVLEPGPISIIRDGTFVGEGLIERIEKGHKSYISYALDTAVNVNYNQNSTSEFASLVKVSRGVVETKTFSILRHLFEVLASREDGEAVPMIVGVPKRPGWEVEVKGGKQESETAESRFYSIAVKPGEKTTMEVREKYPSFSAYHISDVGAQQAMVAYVSSKEAKGEIVAKLQPLVERVRKLSDLRNQIATLEQKRSDLQQRANEIRANLALLKKSRNQKLKDEQLARLVQADRQNSQFTDQLVVARDQSAELTVELNTLVEKLEINF